MIPDFVIVFTVGAVIGSFLNVCIYRIPLGQSVILPSSRCPACGTHIRPVDNIPIVSFILLRGKCRHCRAKIAFRYPLVEFLNALLYVALLWRFGLGLYLPVLCVFSSALIVITFIDLDYQIIPDVITLPGTLIGLITGSLIIPDPFARGSLLGFTQSFVGMLAGGGLFYLIAVASRGGMGGGDIKMMAMVGAVSGWKSVLLTTFAGSLLGSVVGVFLMLFHGKGRKTKVPFGPFLAAGTLITLFFGEEIFLLYLNR